MGDVRDKPNIINSFRVTPISKAIMINVGQSPRSICSRFCHNTGIQDKTAATIREPHTIAIGDM
jgi:hypothetical protein